MTPGERKAYIAMTILAVLAFFAWELWPEPNLDGMRDQQKCEYSSFYKTHGGSRDACADWSANEAAKRLRGSF